MVFVVLASCGAALWTEDNSPTVEPQPLVCYFPDDEPVVITPAPTLAPADPWTDEELDAIALTLAGECYDDKTQDKRLVCEVILNRVCSEGFPDTIVGVVTAPYQFNGYWTQSRPVSENDYEVAEQALRDWYDNDCNPLSKWLYFSAGENRENEFREEF